MGKIVGGMGGEGIYRNYQIFSRIVESGYSRHKDKTIVLIGILDHIWITKNAFMVCFLRLEALLFLFSIPFLPQQQCKVFSHWLIIYPRVYRLQHSPNQVDVGL